MINLDLDFSEHFSYRELLHSGDAEALGYTEQYDPSQPVLINLQRTANMLEEVRALVSGPIRVTSGYRCLRLNDHESGAKNSQHLTGEAVDSVVDGMSVRDYYLLIKGSNIVFDQLIIEHDSAGHLWVHMSKAANGNNRGECFYGELIHGVGTIVHPDGFGTFKQAA